MSRWRRIVGMSGMDCQRCHWRIWCRLHRRQGRTSDTGLRSNAACWGAAANIQVQSYKRKSLGCGKEPRRSKNNSWITETGISAAHWEKIFERMPDYMPILRCRDQSVETCARGRNWEKRKEIIWAERQQADRRETGKQKRNWWGNATGKRASGPYGGDRNLCFRHCLSI